MSEKNLFNLKILMPLNIQTFSDGFDVSDQQRQDWFTQFEQEQAASEVETETDATLDTDTTDTELDSEEEVLEVDEDTEVDTVEDEVTPPTDDHLSDDEQKRNAAFAAMRRENEQLQQQAALIKQMAEHYGMTPEQLQQQWADDQLEKQAEAQNVPVEVLKRQNAQESEIMQLRQQLENQRVTSQIAEVTAKYNASTEDIQAAVTYAQQNGLSGLIFSGAMPFEQAYKLANMDSLITKAEKDAVQKNLSDKKKRQQAAQPKPNGGGSPAVDTDDLDAKAAEAAAKLIADGYF